MKLFTSYINSYKGLSREIWILALVTFINRAGTMVIPFLSIYLKSDKGYNFQQIAWVMSVFGLGSLCGAWLGGKLTKVFGYYKVMFFSLAISGILFIVLQFVDEFAPFCITLLFLMLISDSFRPATYVAVTVYATEENQTRSISLLRLAINLGFSFGPAIGGLIIASIGYFSLFWIDGLTCVFAALVFILFLKQKPQEVVKVDKKTSKLNSPYRDLPYLLLMTIVFLVGFTFLQYFSTIPLYYKEVHHLNEDKIGFLMFINGFLIFLVEMPLVKYIEDKKIAKFKVLFVSIILLALSFIVLNIFAWVGILFIGMLFMTFGEIFNFPFINSISMKRAKGKSTGDYMALFTMAFSLAHILGHNTGFQLISRFGFNITWYVMASILFCSLILLILLKRLNFEL